MYLITSSEQKDSSSRGAFLPLRFTDFKYYNNTIPKNISLTSNDYNSLHFYLLFPLNCVLKYYIFQNCTILGLSPVLTFYLKSAHIR